MVTLASLIAIVAMLTLLGLAYLFSVAERFKDEELFYASTSYDAIMVHTYCPTGAVTMLPHRGRIVIQTAYLLSRRFQCPIIMSVGYTVPGEKRTESQIYHDFMLRNYTMSKEVEVIFGDDPYARDTFGETKEAYRLMLDSGFKKILVVGLRPHLARIIPYWKKVNTRNIAINFFGAYGPIKYYSVELLNVVAEILLPPNTKRREAVLNLIGRKK